jgi:hypothetical protein
MTRVFTFMKELVMKGYKDPKLLANSVNKKFPKITNEIFHTEVYPCFRDTLEHKEIDPNEYLFINLEGSLWIREAFMQCQFH